MSTARVAEFVENIKYEHIPEIVIRKAKTAIRDVIGVSIAAHGDEAVSIARQIAKARGQKKDANIIGRSARVSCETAAFVNSTMATTLDMDDGSMGLQGHLRVHRGHPGGIVVPSAMAVAQRQRATGKQLLEAIVAGYEVSLTIAWIIGHTVLASRTGCYGAAAAAAKLLLLPAEKIVQTMNIVSAHCPDTSYAHIWTRIDMSKEAPAWSAFTAIMAAFLSEAGFRATPSFFDCPEHDGKPFESLGKDWEILGIYFKRYGACRHAHAPVDGVYELVNEHDIDPERITRIIVGCAASKGLNMVNRRPDNVWQAQYSIPFVIGAALRKGKEGLGQISASLLKDRGILGIADKVELVADEDVEALQPGAFAGRVRIETSDGRNYETFIERPKGDPENPFSEEELRSKFDELTVPVIGKESALKIAASIDDLDGMKDINDLFKILIHGCSVGRVQ